jgi:meso-butanediol dehydrogenase / (S,S)-butanediol dehydrogenase / diacetyl reductase
VRRFDGRVALVTGSTSGIGAETARRLASEGASVVVTGRSEDRGNAVAEEIKTSGGAATFLRADISVEEEVVDLFARASEAFGALHVLVNNAAPMDLMIGGKELPLLQQTTENMQLSFQTGVYGVFWCCKYGIPAMQGAGGGAIVNITTVAAFQGHPGNPVYSMMKGAVTSLTRQLAVDFAPDIRVNGVVVGVTTGPEADAILARNGRVAKAWKQANLTRLGHASDVAAAVAFLASDDAAVTTGSFVYVEGGSTIRVNLPDLTRRT